MDVLSSPYARIDKVMDAPVIEKVRALWLKQVDAHPKDLAVLSHAAAQFLLSDRDEAERLLKRGRDLEQHNGMWSQRLGQLYMLALMTSAGEIRKGYAVQALAEYENARALATNDIDRDALPIDLAKSALEAGQAKKAKVYATELAEDAAKGRADWNRGNAIHHAHLILGRLALHDGDIAEAKLQLHAAGETPGSPQLNSFGPNMTLARDLLQRGETEAVLDYFAQCGKFWKMGKNQLDAWTKEAKAGKVPNFGGNLSY